MSGGVARQLVRGAALSAVEAAVAPWLEATNVDALVYDATWGGLISTDGTESQDADFGNGWYNGASQRERVPRLNRLLPCLPCVPVHFCLFWFFCFGSVRFALFATALNALPFESPVAL